MTRPMASSPAVSGELAMGLRPVIDSAMRSRGRRGSLRQLPESTATGDELSAPALQEPLTQPVPLVLPQRPRLARRLGHVRSHCASPDRRLEVVELVAAMGAVLLRPGFVVEGIDRHDHVRAVTGGLDVDGRQVLIRLVAGHEVDQ